MRSRTSYVCIFVACWLSARAVYAQAARFDYKVEDNKGKILWKASANAGLVLNTGNANTVAFTGGAIGSLFDGKNKGAIEVNGTYARAVAISAEDANMSGVIDRGEIRRATTTSAALWNVKLRYDRFLTPRNALYSAGFATGNEPAGIRVGAGGQVGYSRQLLKDEMHLIVFEIGYDFTYQDNVSGVDLEMHSGRIFAGYWLTLNASVSMLFGLEVLANFNRLPGFTEGTTVAPFRATRLNGNAALNAKLWKNIAFQVSFLAKYTTNPAPLPAFDLPFADGYVPLTERLDTVTSLSLVVNIQ